MINGRKIVALCISRIHDVSSYEFTVSLNEKIIGQGYSLFVYNTCSDLEKQSANHTGQASVFEYTDFNVIDAVIVFEGEIRNRAISDGIISRAKTFSKPVIVVGGKHEGCISIDFDGEKGFEILQWRIDELGVTASEGAVLEFNVQHIGDCSGAVEVNESIAHYIDNDFECCNLILE